MSDEKCRERVVARVVSILNQLIQLRVTSVMFDVSTAPIVFAVEKEVSPPLRRHRRQAWCESAETLAAFKPAWTAREDVRQFLRAHPRDRTAWKTLRSAGANLRKVMAKGLHAYFEEYLAETERLLANNDQKGFDSTLLEGAKAKSEKFFRGKDGTHAAAGYRENL